MLLDLNRNREASDFLKAHPLPFKEYHANLAAAYAKLDRGDASRARAANERAANAPSCPHALTGYVDYQAL